MMMALSGLVVINLMSCSSGDDLGAGTAQNPALSGIQLDVASASELASSVLNFKESGTRALATGFSLGLTSSMPAEPTVPAGTATWSEGTSWGAVNRDVVLGAGETYKGGMGLNGHTVYVQGELTLDNPWGNGTVYVLKGGKLIINHGGSFMNNGLVTVYNYGTVTTTQNTFYVGQNEKFYTSTAFDLGDKTFMTQGDVYVGGDLKAKNFTFMSGNKTYVSGSLTSTEDLKMDGSIQVKGELSAPSIYMENANKLVVECAVKTPGLFRIDSNQAEGYFDYVECGSMYQVASSKIYLGDGGMISCSGTYTNLNNGNAASISVTGDNSTAVVKAAKMDWNAGGNLNKCYIFQTPGTASRIALDCPSLNRLGNNSKEVALDYTSLDFAGGNVIWVQNPAETSAINIAKTSCSPGYNFGPEETDPKLPDVIAEINHTHDISATCIQYANGKMYVSYHKRGAEQSGCLEVLQVENDKAALQQFVTDHNAELDFNHITIDAANKRLYTVGNSSKKGAILGYIDLTGDGLMNTTDTLTTAKTAYPLQILSLKAGAKGDGNAVIKNGNTIQVASTYGLETYNASSLEEVTAIDKPGKAKHIAINGNTVVATNLTDRVSDENQAVNIVANTYSASDTKFANPSASIALGQVAPNNGKNVTVVDGSTIYTCLGANGFKVFSTTGTELWSFIPKHAVTASGIVNANCNGVAFDNNYIYLAYGALGLIVVDKNTHKEVARRTLARSANYVAVDSNYIYVAYGQNGLVVYKLVDLK